MLVQVVAVPDRAAPASVRGTGQGHQICCWRSLFAVAAGVSLQHLADDSVNRSSLLQRANASPPDDFLVYGQCQVGHSHPLFTVLRASSVARWQGAEFFLRFTPLPRQDYADFVGGAPRPD